MSNFTKIIKYIKNNKLSLRKKILAWGDFDVTMKHSDNLFNVHWDALVQKMLLDGAVFSRKDCNMILTADGISIQLDVSWGCYGNFCTIGSSTSQSCSRLTRYLLVLKELEHSHLEKLTKREKETEIINNYVRRVRMNSTFGAQQNKTVQTDLEKLTKKYMTKNPMLFMYESTYDSSSSDSDSSSRSSSDSISYNSSSRSSSGSSSYSSSSSSSSDSSSSSSGSNSSSSD